MKFAFYFKVLKIEEGNSWFVKRWKFKYLKDYHIKYLTYTFEKRRNTFKETFGKIRIIANE